MSVSKNKGTNLLRSSEKRSLRRFLTLYFILVVMILSLLGTFYYESEEKLMFSNQRTLLSNHANEEVQELRRLHRDFPKRTEYPKCNDFRSAIYDIERVEIFSKLKNTNVNFDKEMYRVNNTIQFVKYLDDYYLGAKYLFVEIDEDKTWYKNIMIEILTLGSIALIILAIFGLFFVNLFLRPMKNSITLLDNFIKDVYRVLAPGGELAILELVRPKNPLVQILYQFYLF